MIGWAEALKVWPTHVPSYNRAPTTQVAAFRSESGELMRWGMIPSWSKSFESKYATFNARIETVADKPTFRSAWHNSQRCLIPMGGYYEWKGDKGNKQPFYITDRDTGGIVVAGLRESWEGDENLSCTVLTKPADQELAHIHHRVPIMLSPKHTESWLNGELDPLSIERPSVIYFPVGKAVGNSRNDGAELIEPVS